LPESAVEEHEELSVAVIFATDLGLPEAPLLLPDGSWLVGELAFERGRVTQISPDGAEHRTVAETGRPNGLALGADGAIWVCETLAPSLIRLGLDGAFERVVEAVGGQALLWPNDVCFGPDGALYFTDSGVLVGDFLDAHGKPVRDCEALPVDGKVIRFDPSTGDTRILAGGLKFANGIAFGPDGRLYVNETFTGDVHRYDVGPDGALSSPALFGNVLDPDWRGSGLRGPDGMAFAADGRLFVAVFGQADVTVLDPDGRIERRLGVLGAAPTNVAFGRDGERALYVVEDERGRIERYEVGVDGLPLHT
jgi:gluconolactonase